VCLFFCCRHTKQGLVGLALEANTPKRRFKKKTHKKGREKRDVEQPVAVRQRLYQGKREVGACERQANQRAGNRDAVGGSPLDRPRLSRRLDQKDKTAKQGSNFEKEPSEKPAPAPPDQKKQNSPKPNKKGPKHKFSEQERTKTSPTPKRREHGVAKKVVGRLRK